MAKAIDEDPLLVPEQFARLNQEFYSSELAPDKYIGGRLHSLLLVTSSSDLVKRASAAGFQVGNVNLKYAFDEDESRWDEDNYLITESTVLLHHAGETLLRLFFAHEEDPPCPWLETARLRQPGAFPKRVREMVGTLDSDATLASITHVFMGNGSLEDRPVDMSSERWIEQQAGLVALLHKVGEFILGDADLYNSAKHGLTTLPSDVSVAFNFPPDAPLIDLSMDGKALRYLRSVKDQEASRRWHAVSSWISAEANLTLTYLISQQIKTLLAVARARYLQDAGGQFHVSALTPEYVETSAGVGWPQKSIVLRSMAEQLHYNSAPDRP